MGWRSLWQRVHWIVSWGWSAKLTAIWIDISNVPLAADAFVIGTSPHLSSIAIIALIGDFTMITIVSCSLYIVEQGSEPNKGNANENS